MGSDSLVVNEIYVSLQGESTYAGLPCVFIRLTGCNLRCSYCDTAYAFTEGKRRPLHEVVQRVDELALPYAGRMSPMKLPLVELTGGEPLLQPSSFPLMSALCDQGYTVLLETSGAHDISSVDPRVRRIMDLKCPSSGEKERNRMQNLSCLKASDEIKFVVGTQEDYAWVREVIQEHQLQNLCPLLVSWVYPLQSEQKVGTLKSVPIGQTPIGRQELVEKIVEDALPVRFQLQMHKIIWPPAQRGV